MSGTNPSKRPNDNNDEESSKRRKERLEEFERRVAQLREDENRGRSQPRSSGGHEGRGGSQGGILHRSGNVQDDTQSFVPIQTPDRTLGSGMSRANPLSSLPSGRPLDRATTGNLGNGFIDLSPLGSNDVASFTGNGLVSRGATQGLAQRVAPARHDSVLSAHLRYELLRGQSNQGQGQPGDQQREPVSTKPPEKSWKDAPRLPKGSEARAKDATRPKCDRLELRLKKNTDENGTEKSLMNMVTFDGRATNLLSPVQCLNDGVTMGISSLGDKTFMNRAFDTAAKAAAFKDKPHMGHVWHLFGPILKRPDLAQDSPPSARYDRVFLSSVQEDIDLPPKISGDIDMSSHSDMECILQETDELTKQRDQAIKERNQAIRERDQAIQERDQAIRDTDALIASVRTGNPYRYHDIDELVGQYATSEIHAKLCEDFTKKWEEKSSLCATRLEKAPSRRFRHTVIKFCLDEIDLMYEEFNARATGITASNTIGP